MRLVGLLNVSVERSLSIFIIKHPDTLSLGQLIISLGKIPDIVSMESLLSSSWDPQLVYCETSEHSLSSSLLAIVMGSITCLMLVVILFLWSKDKSKPRSQIILFFLCNNNWAEGHVPSCPAPSIFRISGDGRLHQGRTSDQQGNIKPQLMELSLQQ